MSPETLAMSSYQFIALDQVDLQHIVDVFNESFADYAVPFTMSEAVLSEKLVTDRIRLDKSVGAVNDGKLIGFMLTGYDTMNGRPAAYNAGTGVIPAHRRRGISKKLYRELFQIFTADGIESVLLEVLSTNDKAIRLYRSLGFEITREFSCVKGETGISNGESQVGVSVVQSFRWEDLAKFWDYPPSWQNWKSAVDSSSNVKTLQATFNGELKGYACFNPHSGRILQLAVDKNSRHQGIGRAMLRHIASECERELSIINIDSRATDTLRFFNRAGMVEFARQFEMRADLAGPKRAQLHVSSLHTVYQHINEFSHH